jgi:Uma2 family endonuclease
MSTTRPARSGVVYPESDGKPMAETPVHLDVMLELIETLRHHFAEDPKVYVAGNMMMYYVEGDPRKTFSSDVFMTRGIPKDEPRRVYLVWAEKTPDLVIEVSSRKTARKDTREKFELYQDILRVPEYFLFDPLREYLKPALRGYRLGQRGYEAIEPIEGRLPSQTAGLHLEADGERLRLYDPTRREYLMSAAEARRDGERQAVALLTAEAERDELRRELERLRGEGR